MAVGLRYKQLGITKRGAINILFRGVTLMSKFTLVFVLAKAFNPGDLGTYGVISAVIGYGVYLVGLEFYTFFIREVIGLEVAEIRIRLKSSLVLYLGIYAFFFPLYILLFQFDFLSGQYFYLILSLLILEHLTQELFRLLNALEKQIGASTILFFKSGFWAILFSIAVLLGSKWPNIETLLVIWNGSLITSLLFAGYLLKEYLIGFSSVSIDIKWIKKGLRASSVLLLASLITRGLFTFDRLIIAEFYNSEILGTFILFISVCLALITFLDASLIDFEMPHLVRTAKFETKNQFKIELGKFAVSLVSITCVLGILFAISINFLLKWIGKEIYLDNVYIYYWLLANTVIYALTLIPHILLFSYDKRKEILFSQLPGFLFFMLFSILSGKSIGIDAILFGFTVNFLSVLLLKVYFSFKVLNND